MAPECRCAHPHVARSFRSGGDLLSGHRSAGSRQRSLSPRRHLVPRPMPHSSGQRRYGRSCWRVCPRCEHLRPRTAECDWRRGASSGQATLEERREGRVTLLLRFMPRSISPRVMTFRNRSASFRPASHAATRGARFGTANSQNGLWSSRYIRIGRLEEPLWHVPGSHRVHPLLNKTAGARAADGQQPP